LAQNLQVKCWWNWHLESARVKAARKTLVKLWPLWSISSTLNVRIFHRDIVFSSYVWLGAKNLYEKRVQKKLVKMTSEVSPTKHYYNLWGVNIPSVYWITDIGISHVLLLCIKIFITYLNCITGLCYHSVFCTFYMDTKVIQLSGVCIIILYYYIIVLSFNECEFKH